MKRLSVIVLTYNSENDIYDCLSSIYHYNDIGDDLEVIVVDNQSREYEAMRARILHEFPITRIVQNTHNSGYGQGNNVGIRLAEAPIVAIMNPDVRMLMPTFAAMLKPFEDTDVIMTGAKQLSKSGKQLWSTVCSYKIPGIWRIGLRTILDRFDYYNYKFMYFAGAFFMVRKKEFEEIGLFDEDLFMYSEEPDIHIRFRERFPNKRMCYLPKIHYLHLASVRTFSPERYRTQLRGDLYVYQKHNLSIASYFRTHILITYIFQIIHYIRKNNSELEACKQRRSILRQTRKQMRNTLNNK